MDGGNDGAAIDREVSDRLCHKECRGTAKPPPENSYEDMINIHKDYDSIWILDG